MGRPFCEHLDGDLYVCRACRQHIARRASLVSRQFHSRAGRCYLFEQAANVVAGPPEERLMTTGRHVVRDLACSRCLAPLGWRYDAASEPSQGYKVGKTILERASVAAARAEGDGRLTVLGAGGGDSSDGGGPEGGP
jgi:hypothetical protein